MADTQDRTEEATPRRREEARKKGQIARSAELTSALGFVISLAVAKSSFSGMRQRVEVFTVHATGALLSAAGADMSEVQAHNILTEAFATVMAAAAPVVLTAMAVGLAANFAQVGFVFVPSVLAPQFSRLNPGAGLARMFSKRALMELAKSIVKVIIIGWFGYSAMQAKIPGLMAASGAELGQGLRMSGDALVYVATRMGIPLLAIGAVDYIFQKRELEKNLRMTKQELKEEMREQEGDPQIRAAIRSRQRQIAMRRMMEDVKTADVVVVNPTHYAVAIKYDQDKMRAPRVVAKGQRLIAQRIKDVARQAGVPIVENPPVAQALFHACQLGQEIPPELYRAVAEILAYVYRVSREQGSR